MKIVVTEWLWRVNVFSAVQQMIHELPSTITAVFHGCPRWERDNWERSERARVKCVWVIGITCGDIRDRQRDTASLEPSSHAHLSMTFPVVRQAASGDSIASTSPRETEDYKWRGTDVFLTMMTPMTTKRRKAMQWKVRWATRVLHNSQRESNEGFEKVTTFSYESTNFAIRYRWDKSYQYIYTKVY